MKVSNYLPDNRKSERSKFEKNGKHSPSNPQREFRTTTLEPLHKLIEKQQKAKVIHHPWRDYRRHLLVSILGSFACGSVLGLGQSGLFTKAQKAIQRRLQPQESLEFEDSASDPDVVEPLARITEELLYQERVFPTTLPEYKPQAPKQKVSQLAAHLPSHDPTLRPEYSQKNHSVQPKTRPVISKAPTVAIPKTAISPNSNFQKQEAPSKLRLFHAHTHERLSLTFAQNGQEDRSALDALDNFFRDWRRSEIKKIDIALYYQLSHLNAKMGSHSEIVLLSGYRSKKTNMMLARKSGSVARNSYHIKGMAADITLPGSPLSELYHNALRLNSGGVGYYPSRHFIHIDSGPIRSWPAKYRSTAIAYRRQGLASQG